MAQKIPSASSTSPMLITSRMIGIGRGMTSPKSPPPATNSATVSARRRKWKGSLAITDSSKPAAMKAASQIGIWPALTRTATMFAPMPTAAIWSPGTRQLPHSQTKIRP